MICVSEEATSRAFEAFRLRRGEWVEGLGLQLRMYRAAARAFGEAGGLDDFLVVYTGLRKWKLFRAGRVEDAAAVFAWLNSLDRNLGQRRLSELGSNDWRIVWDAICRMRNVKPNKTGPSLMAISKFLHFWNPRLFVICDQEEVEGFVLGHRWLARELDSMGSVLGAAGANADKEPRLSRYLQLLALASELVKANPHILPEFAWTVHSLVGGAEVPADIETYEATAAEWCLVGLGEMPPGGLTMK